jgi:hypothetical protein
MKSSHSATPILSPVDVVVLVVVVVVVVLLVLVVVELLLLVVSVLVHPISTNAHKTQKAKKVLVSIWRTPCRVVAELAYRTVGMELKSAEMIHGKTRYW